MREGARERGSEQGGRESPHSLFGQAKVAPAVEGVSIINPEKVINAEIFPRFFFTLNVISHNPLSLLLAVNLTSRLGSQYEAFYVQWREGKKKLRTDKLTTFLELIIRESSASTLL